MSYIFSDHPNLLKHKNIYEKLWGISWKMIWRNKILSIVINQQLEIQFLCKGFALQCQWRFHSCVRPLIGRNRRYLHSFCCKGSKFQECNSVDLFLPFTSLDIALLHRTKYPAIIHFYLYDLFHRFFDTVPF